VSYRASSLFVWFAVGGGCVAWAIQFVIGLAFGDAECNQAGRGVPVHVGQLAASAVAAVVTLASLGAALRLFQNTYRAGDIFAEERRGDGATPPVGRINFLAIVGLTVNFLVLVLIVIQGIAPSLQPTCLQT
jgi:hypothetical protein